MNLLSGRIEIPRPVWEENSLSAHEKLLLAGIVARDGGDGVSITDEDVAHSLRLPVCVAVNILDGLIGRGLLLMARMEGRQRWLQISDTLKAAIELERTTPRIQLTMFFVQCRCGYDLRMDHIDQIRVCPECLKPVELSEMGKQYVRERNRSP